mmetsp:Transcript_133992/g.373452  ORF Transcript_133992/g.373452 Transcript_133992/m.373452 type:complete len:116 (+) Transcript_133992:31-378(+)
MHGWISFAVPDGIRPTTSPRRATWSAKQSLPACGHKIECANPFLAYLNLPNADRVVLQCTPLGQVQKVVEVVDGVIVPKVELVKGDKPNFSVPCLLKDLTARGKRRLVQRVRGYK